MRYIMSFIMSVLLIAMLNFVASSILGSEFNFENGLYVSIIFTVLVFIIGGLIPNESTPDTDEKAH